MFQALHTSDVPFGAHLFLSKSWCFPPGPSIQSSAKFPLVSTSSLKVLPPTYSNSFIPSGNGIAQGGKNCFLGEGEKNLSR